MPPEPIVGPGAGAAVGTVVEASMGAVVGLGVDVGEGVDVGNGAGV